jgi:Triose-phosphate Transporter family
MTLTKSATASKAMEEPFLATAKSLSSSSSSSSTSCSSSSGKNLQASSTFTKIAVVMFLYCVSGTALTLVNKVAMTTFPFPNVVLVLQNVATVVMLCIGSAASPLMFGRMPPLSRQTLTLWAPLAVAFVVMLISSMLALLEVSAVTLIVIRNLTSITVAVLEYGFLGTRVPAQGAVALLGMLAGAVMFSLHDLTFSLRGYLWLLANLVATSSYQVAVKGIISSKKSHKIGPFGFAYLNNVLSLPLIAALSVATREPRRVLVALPALDAPTVMVLALSCVLGCLLSVTGFILNTMISATSLMVANNANKFMVIVLSEIFIQRTLDTGATVGVALVLLFGGLYARSRQKKATTDKGSEDRTVKPSSTSSSA